MSRKDEKVHQVVCNNCLLAVRSVAEQVYANWEIVRQILTENKMCKVWYDPKMKRQNVQWKTANSPHPKNFVSTNEESTQWCWHVLIFNELFTMNSNQLGTQWIKLTM